MLGIKGEDGKIKKAIFTNDVSVRTFRTERYKYHSEKGWYFFNAKISSDGKDGV